MLIKKNLKTERFVSCPIVLKLKRQYFPFYPTCKKQNERRIASTLSFSPSSPAIEQPLLKELPCQLGAKRQGQKEKTILRFLYPTNFFNFQREQPFSGSFCTRTAFFTLIESKKKSNVTFAPFVHPLGKQFQLKITLKSCSSQLKDIEVSLSAISKLVHFLNNCYTKQFKAFLVDSLYSSSFDSSSFFYSSIKVANSNNAFKGCPRVSSTFNLLRNFKTWIASFQKKQNLAAQMPLISLNLLTEQPLIELLDRKAKVKGRQREHFSFLFSKLQKTNYCNRYFFKSSASLDNNGPTNKQVQKTLNSIQLFTVIRSPFVFKKTREQFNLQKVFYNVTINSHSPIQKELFIQCFSLLRLPVELEIHC